MKKIFLLAGLIISYLAGFSQANNVNTKVLSASQSVILRGNRIDSISADTSFTGGSDNVIATQRAIKKYVATPVAVVGAGISPLYVSNGTFYWKNIQMPYAGQIVTMPDSSVAVLLDTTVVIAPRSWVDSLLNTIHPGAQLLTWTPGPTTSILSISNGNVQTITPATSSNQGLMDTASQHMVAGLIALPPNFNNVLSRGTALSGNYTVTFPNKTLIWSAQGTGKFDIYGLLQDTTNVRFVLTKKTDSSTSELSLANLSLDLPLKFQHTIFTPSTGNTIVAVNNQQNIINPTGTIAALTITLPTVPINGDVIWFMSKQNITVITYTGSTVLGHASAIADIPWSITYDVTTTSWY